MWCETADFLQALGSMVKGLHERDVENAKVARAKEEKKRQQKMAYDLRRSAYQQWAYDMSNTRGYDFHRLMSAGRQRRWKIPTRGNS